MQTKCVRGGFKTLYGLKENLASAGVPNKYLKNVSFPYFAVFDIESSLENARRNMMECFGGPAIVSSEHVPMAIGVTTNFFEKPKIFVTKKSGVGVVSIVNRFIKYILWVAKRANKLYCRKTRRLQRYLKHLYRFYISNEQFENG